MYDSSLTFLSNFLLNVLFLSPKGDKYCQLHVYYQYAMHFEHQYHIFSLQDKNTPSTINRKRMP